MNDNTNLTEIVAEAVREYVGDGDGADEEVLAAYEQQIRAQISAEIEARCPTYSASNRTENGDGFVTGMKTAALIAHERNT